MEKHWPESLNSKLIEIVRDSDLDKLIEETFGREWSVQQNTYEANGTLIEFEVYPDPEATSQVEAWVNSRPASLPGRPDQKGDCGYKPGFSIGEDVTIYTTTILSEMCNRGILPEGDMTVHVYW